MLRTKKLTTFALILAIVIIFQIGSFFLSKFLVGTIVNFSLLFATFRLSRWYGALLAFLTPTMAMIIGHSNPLFIPLIFLGNLIFLLIFRLIKPAELENFKNLPKKIIIGVVASIAKMLFLYVAIVKITLPLSLVGIPATVAQKTIAIMSFTMSVVQLITALLASGVAIIIFPKLLKISIINDVNISKV